MINQTIFDKARDVRIEDVIAARNIKLASGHGERCGPCPRCGGTDRFAINVRKQVFHCRRCRAGGDAIALVQFLDDVDFPAAVETLAGPAPERTAKPQDPAAIAAQRRADAARRKDADDHSRAEENTRRVAALAMWRQGVAENGSGIVAQYLREARGIRISPDDWAYLSPRVIRFHERCRFGQDYRPAIVFLFRNVATDAAQAIFRIALTPDGKKIGKGLAYGPRGANSFAGLAAIKLFDDADVDQGLVLAEGIETALAAAYRGGYRPVWAMGGADGIKAFPVLPGVDGLTILGERDKPGVTASEDAVRECGGRWAKAGREVIVWRSERGDFNDSIREDANGKS